MSNPSIFYTDPSLNVYTASVQTASGFPYSNLNDYDIQTVWSSSDASNAQYLQVALSSSQVCTAIIVDNHNWFSAVSSSFEVSASTTSSFETLTYSSSISFTSNDTWYLTLPSITAQYFRFNFIDAVNAAPYAGNVWIPTQFTFESAYRWGNVKEDASYTTSKKTNLNGTIIKSQTYAGRIVYQLQFTLQSDTAKRNFQTFHHSVRGMLHPFYFLDIDGTTIRYMHVEDYVPVTGHRYNRNDIQSLTMNTDQGTF